MSTIQIIQFTQQDDTGVGGSIDPYQFCEVIDFKSDIEHDYEDDDGYEETEYVPAIRVQDKDGDRTRIQEDSGTLYNLITITF